MTMGLGAAVIEDGATPFDLALADVEAEELLTINAELIRDNWDPFKVATRNIGFLAFAMGVTLWDDEWPEQTKRQWIADQWEFKAKRGTEEAFRMALSLWGYTLVEVLTPPQGFYASEEFTKEQRDAWLARMPQLRIRVGRTTGKANPADEWFAGESFAGEAFAMPNDGHLLLNRRGFLRQNGVDTPLQSVVTTTSVSNRVVTDVERIAIPGVSSQGWFAGEDFVGEEDKFTNVAEVEARLVTVRLDRSYVHEESTLGLTTADVGLEPLDVRYQRISDIGDGTDAWFAGVDFAGEAFALPDDAGELLADVLFLHDPSVAVPMTAGISFAGVDRVGIEPNTAELMIDLHQVAEAGGWFADKSFAGESFAIEDDDKARDNALRACVAAKALRDTVLVSFAPRRPLQFSDPITATTRAGDWVRDLL